MVTFNVFFIVMWGNCKNLLYPKKTSPSVLDLKILTKKVSLVNLFFTFLKFLRTRPPPSRGQYQFSLDNTQFFFDAPWVYFRYFIKKQKPAVYRRVLTGICLKSFIKLIIIFLKL